METSITHNPLYLESDTSSFLKFFQEKGSTETLTNEACELLSVIVRATLEAVVKGSCKLAAHRKSDSLGLHDVVLFLKAHFNLDPLVVGAGYYFATETTFENPVPPKRKYSKSTGPKRPKSSESLEPLNLE